MPVNIVKSPEGEKYWGEAKKAAKKQYPDLESKDKDRFYAVVMTIYKNMCKNKGCAVKKESMSSLLNRLEESVNLDLPKTYKDWLLNEPSDRVSADFTKKAVNVLNTAMKDAAVELTKSMRRRKMHGIFVEKDEGKVLSWVWKKYIKPIFDNKIYDIVGFGEPEPRVLAGQKLINVIKDFYGITGWTNLGDYI